MCVCVAVVSVYVIGCVKLRLACDSEFIIMTGVTFAHD